MLQRITILQKIIIFTYIACSFHAFANDNVSMLKSYIASEYKRIYPELTIESISLITRSTPDLYTITIISKQLNTTKSSKGYIALQYKYNGKILQDSIRYIINGYIQVYTATDNIKAGSNIEANSFVGKAQDFSSLSMIPASKYEILKSSAKVYIPINTIIYRNKLSKKMLVYKDSNVKIIFRENGIEASSSGKALQNGMKSDIIKVENLESKRTINAKVIAENIVQIY